MNVWAGLAIQRELLWAEQEAAFAGQPAPLREAEIFGQIIESLPLALADGARLAGEAGWSDTEIAALRHRREAGLRPPPASPTPDEILARQMDERFDCRGGYSLAHTCADFPLILNEGLNGILIRIASARTSATGEAAVYLDAMRLAVSACGRLAERYAALAEATAGQATTPAVRWHWERLAAACRQVPLNPARNFHEALQSCLLVNIAIGLAEYSGASLTWGRLDQHLLPLYRRDLAAGVPPPELEADLADFYRLLNTSTLGDAAGSINLGGADAAGQDQFNELSALLLDLARRKRQPAPLLALRVTENLPDEVFDRALLPELAAGGQPSFYGETACRRALERRGVPADEIPGWAVNSCMGLLLPGQEVLDMWGGVVNALLPLELALNAGRPFATELPLTLRTPVPSTYASPEELIATYAPLLGEIIDYVVERNRRATRHAGRERPNPFFSALLTDCIGRGRDRANGGARYHTVVIEAFGLANVAEALVAIDRLVWREKRHTVAELVAAARANFADPAGEKTRSELLAQPKYGQGEPQVDRLLARLAADFAARVRAHDAEGRVYAPSFHTLNAHVRAGAKTAASLDGRRAGEPLAKNIGPTAGRGGRGHTALIASAAAVDQAEFFGGQALDLSLPLSDLGTPAGRVKYRDLFKTYFRLGGLEIQVNAQDAAALRRAHAAPAEHRDVLVRLGGFTTRYVDLAPTIREEMIARIECGQ